MSYLFKQKLNLGDLSLTNREIKRVLVFEPEEYLAALYANYVRNQEFEVRHCLELEEVPALIVKFSPHLLVFNAEALDSPVKSKSWLVSLKNRHPELHVVTIGYNISSEGVRELMSAGISSHINRHLSRPNDIAHIIKAILN
ncbi:MAG: hypothetical protein HY918_03920 [Candidatus Doudnabacteria bacterium]|nr:hypothetical protein [Candidatus Doudnabacteria bacterium]